MTTMTKEEANVVVKQRIVRLRVADENRRQLAKWGAQSHDPSFWYLTLMEEMGELAAALLGEDEAHAIPPEHRSILMSAHNIGVAAQMTLEGKLPDRINIGLGTVAEGHNSAEEAIHVAAVAVAMEESRRRGGAR